MNEASISSQLSSSNISIFSSFSSLFSGSLSFICLITDRLFFLQDRKLEFNAFVGSSFSVFSASANKSLNFVATNWVLAFDKYPRILAWHPFDKYSSLVLAFVDISKKKSSQLKTIQQKAMTFIKFYLNVGVKCWFKKYLETRRDGLLYYLV